MADAPKDTRSIVLTAGDRGIVMRSMDEMWRFAVAVDKSGLAPQAFKTPESILIAIQMGFEIGLPPMAALRSIAVINNRPSLWGDAMLALCMASPDFDHGGFEEVEVNGEAVCRCKRKSSSKVTERRFSMSDAKSAGLAGKAGPWVQYPRRMMQMRARSWALRDTFPDVLQGIIATEEARDVVDAEVVSAHTETSAPKSGVDRVKAALREAVKRTPPAQNAPLPTSAPVDKGPVAGPGDVDAPAATPPAPAEAETPAVVDASEYSIEDQVPTPMSAGQLDADDIEFRSVREQSEGSRVRFKATVKRIVNGTSTSPKQVHVHAGASNAVPLIVKDAEALSVGVGEVGVFVVDVLADDKLLLVASERV